MDILRQKGKNNKNRKHLLKEHKVRSRTLRYYSNELKCEYRGVKHRQKQLTQKEIQEILEEENDEFNIH